MDALSSNLESILIEAQLSAEDCDGIGIGSVLPVQFVSESGTSLPLLNGTVIATSEHPDTELGNMRIEIALSLRDLTTAARRS